MLFKIEKSVLKTLLYTLCIIKKYQPKIKIYFTTKYNNFSIMVLSFYTFYSYICFFQVHLQTQKKPTKGLLATGINVVKSDGIIGLYSGISASILRQVQNFNKLSISPCEIILSKKYLKIGKCTYSFINFSL